MLHAHNSCMLCMSDWTSILCLFWLSLWRLRRKTIFCPWNMVQLLPGVVRVTQSFKVLSSTKQLVYRSDVLKRSSTSKVKNGIKVSFQINLSFTHCVCNSECLFETTDQCLYCKMICVYCIYVLCLSVYKVFSVGAGGNKCIMPYSFGFHLK